MELRKFGFERYKGYAEPTELEFAPLTILVGANNSGKTALAQAIQLFAGGLNPSRKDMYEPLPLVSGGIRHGQAFEDLVTGRPVHGWLRLHATLSDDGSELSLSATVRNVVFLAPPAARQISRWRLRSDEEEVRVVRLDYVNDAEYGVFFRESKLEDPVELHWRGLIPLDSNGLAGWAEAKIDALRTWGLGVRYLRCPRNLLSSPLPTPERPTLDLGSNGENAPLVLAADDGLREVVREWYRKVFGVGIDVVAQGTYFELAVRASARDASVRLMQSGRGLAHVLPVVVTALTARIAGPGVDIIEHPEAELHPAVHADVADLLLDNLAGSARPMVVETHSEMLLLRARRWIAERRIPPESVLVYWIDTEPGRGSVVRKIRINERGEMDFWPEGVFIEDYDEILAIRRANRSTD